jgi:lysophospholipid acyltransferase (LPLAT)-like uncharacterized protein
MGKSRLLWRPVGWYLGLCRRTMRWTLDGEAPLQALARQPGGFVLVFWHECLPMMPMAWERLWDTVTPRTTPKEGLVLVSRSRDGAMISSMLGDYGLTTVAGSSSRGGRDAGRKLLRGVKAGSIAVIIPDGPRGPRRVVSDGAVRIAMMAGVPIVPCGAYAAPCRKLRSWDRMMFPLPFSRCVAVVAEPILPAGQDPDALAGELSASLNATMERASVL